MMPEKPKIMITADDFGICAERNAGIVKAFREGLVTQASLLVNGMETMSALELSQKYKIPLILHINVTEGIPLSADDVSREVLAQITWFKQHAGSLYRIDGHQHVHIIPQLTPVLTPLFIAEQIKMIRIPEEDISPYTWLTQPQINWLHKISTWAKLARASYSAHCLLKPEDRFIGLGLIGQNLTKERLQYCFERQKPLESSVIEYMCHPGNLCLMDIPGSNDENTFNRSQQRQHELTVLTDKNSKLWVTEQAVLTDFLTELHAS